MKKINITLSIIFATINYYILLIGMITGSLASKGIVDYIFGPLTGLLMLYGFFSFIMPIAAIITAILGFIKRKNLIQNFIAIIFSLIYLLLYISFIAGALNY